MASKRHQRKRGCDRKQRYTEAEAKHIAWSMNRRFSLELRVMAYHCPHCGSAWHVGHNGALAVHNRKWKGRR